MVEKGGERLLGILRVSFETGFLFPLPLMDEGGFPFIEGVDPSGDGKVSCIIVIRPVVMSWLVRVVVLVESAFDE